MQRHTRWCRLGAALPTALMLTVACGGAKAAPVTGAVFTTGAGCVAVDNNIYDNKDAVYINGGPTKPGAAGLPDGYYYVQVTDPSGAHVLGTSVGSGIVLGTSTDTPVHVTNGDFDACYQLSAILIKGSDSSPGYDNTPNDGGEYKVWVSNVSTFDNNSTKTDNFKIRQSETCPDAGGDCTPKAVLSGVKYFDANGNGALDSSESPLSSGIQVFQIHITGPGVDITTPTNMHGQWSASVPQNQLYTVCEVAVDGWTHTGPVKDATNASANAVADASQCWDVTLGTEDTAGLDFGNVSFSVSKTANASFKKTFTWDITKDVDKTLVTQSGSTWTFNYTVGVTHDDGTASDEKVTGKITVSNPGPDDIVVDVTDATDNGGVCSVPSGSPATIPAGKSVDFDYTCVESDTSSGNNTATATLTKDISRSSVAVPFSFGAPILVDDCVDVTDPLSGNPKDVLGTVCTTDTPPTTFTYSHEVTGTPGTCVSQDNTATFTTNTTGATGTAKQTVKLCEGADLTVTKDATPSFTRTDSWGIQKSVDKTLVEQLGGTATFKYSVVVSQAGFGDSDWKVTGGIHVANPNDFEGIALTGVTDNVDDGGTCTLTGGDSPTSTILASGSATLAYTCTYPVTGPSPAAGTATNTATATWDASAASTPDGSNTGTAKFDFSKTTPTLKDSCVAVSDSYAGSLGTVCVADAPKTFTYSRTINIPTNGCLVYPNTARFTTADTSATNSSSQSVKVCGPAKTGALTMGFWQNKNGQGIITGGASTGGVCNSATWLRNYAPFQDLSATASCGAVGTYVTNVIKAASAGGTTMNPMLKAQMLATALDVYFSDSSLGGNKIGAPGAIGGVMIDLTKIPGMTDSSSGGTPNGGYENVSSAFGGATSLTVLQMLSYAASQSNAGGTSWYGQVKATQGLAKDAFDAINNQVAFAKP